MTADDSALESLAGAILDGTPIDWSVAGSAGGEVDRALLRRLQEIATLAGALRADPPDTWGHLRLLERIGQGAFGDVYRAWDSRLDREVALKLLPADDASGAHQASSIIEEGRLLARLQHPNVVTIYGAERLNGRVGFWMEYVHGRTLHQMVVDDGRRFTTSEVVEIGQELCRAVTAVHAAGLLHRDIKAQNVMVSTDGRVALMDFGTGQDVREGPTAGMAGTPLYLAPEMLTGRSSPSVQTDIYSMGVVLYFLLSGRFPVTAGDLAGLRAAHVRGDRRPLRALRPDLPHRVCRVIERATHPDPRQRYQSADALRAALAGAQPWRLATAAPYAATAAAVILAGLVVWRSDAPTPASGAGPEIAVLPFINVSADPDNEYLADGLTDEVIRRLSTTRGLAVRSRTSSFAFKSRERNLDDVGRRLNVEYVADGTFLLAGGRLRVESRLVEVISGATVWSDTFEGGLTVADLQRIQDDISRGIVAALDIPHERGSPQETTNIEAYALYLRARSLAERGGTEPLLAVQYFEKAIAADPGYARGHAGLALAYAYMTMSPYQTVSFEIAHPIMRRAALEAVRLDPDLAEAQAARGWVHAREFEWKAAERAFENAIRLNPGLTLAYTSYVYSTLRPMGRVQEAEALLRQAVRNDPLGFTVQRELAQVLYQAGRPEEAIPMLELLRTLDSDLLNVDHTLGRALVAVGRAEESLPLLERHQQRLIEPRTDRHPWVAFAYVALGRRGDAESLARENDHLPFRKAIINAALGNADRMFDGLEEMADREPQRLAILMHQPELTPYRTDARFADLLRRMNLTE